MSKPFAVFDIETDPFQYGEIPEAFLCGFYDGENFKSYEGADCCEKFVLDQKSYSGIIYAHNFGKFDFQYIYEFLLKHHLIENVLDIGGRIVEIKTKGPTYRDSIAILVCSLKKLGGKKEIDINKLEKSVRHLYMEEIKEYHKQDHISLFEALTDFFAEYPCKITAASTSFDMFKKVFGFKVEKTGKIFDETFRKFYYGGRVECFKKGHFEGDFSVIDINSAYPFAMTFAHFWGGGYETENKLRKEFKTGFFHVLAHNDGCLPQRTKENGLTFNATYGEFFMSGWELSAGIETGRVKVEKVLMGYYPKETLNFKSFVTHFHDLKQLHEKNGNGRQREFCKIMLNSLYGRFALNVEDFNEYKFAIKGSGGPEPKKPAKSKNKNLWEIFCDYENYTLWRRKKPLNPDKDEFLNVATAASITGLVRAYLFLALHKCGNPFYCDTDCIIAKTADCEKISQGLNLGDFKLEAQGVSLSIAGRKLYAFELKNHITKDGKKITHKIASKGVKATPEQIKRIAEGETIEFKREAPCFSLKPPRFIKRRIKKT